MTRTGFGVQRKTSFITVFYPKDRAADRVGRAAGTALFVRNERCGASGRALGGASHLTASLVPPGPTEVSGDVEQAWESRPGNARGRSSCPWKTQRGLSNHRPNRGEGSRGSPTQTCIKNKKRARNVSGDPGMETIRTVSHGDSRAWPRWAWPRGTSQRASLEEADTFGAGDPHGQETHRHANASPRGGVWGENSKSETQAAFPA